MTGLRIIGILGLVAAISTGALACDPDPEARVVHDLLASRASNAEQAKALEDKVMLMADGVQKAIDANDTDAACKKIDEIKAMILTYPAK